MNILFVSQAWPDVNGRGFEKRAAQHLESLLKMGPVTLVVPLSQADLARSRGRDPEALGVHRLIVRAEPTLAEVSQQAYAAASNPLLRFFHGLRRRYDTDQYVLAQDRNRYRALLDEPYGLVFAFRIGAAIWAGSVLGTAHPAVRIVDFDDIESIAMARNSAGRPHGLFWGLIIRKYIAGLRRTEDRLAREWDLVLTCSKQDAALLEARGYRSEFVPNSVSFPPVTAAGGGDLLRILFVGTLSYGPNSYGIVWFVNEVWPRLVASLGTRVELLIAGFDPPADILALGRMPGVRVLGAVDNLAAVYAQASLIISPIFSGSGTRIKIIEAFAYERAVVTTSIGCEGLELDPGCQALITDTAEGFAAAILDLAASDGARLEIARRGREYGLRHFSAEVSAARFSRIVSEAVARPRSPRRRPGQPASGGVS